MFQFSFDFRTTLPLEIVLLTHIPTCIHRTHVRTKVAFVQMSTEAFSTNIAVVVVTPHSHMPSQLQSIYHFHNHPSLSQILRKQIEYTHTVTRPEIHAYTRTYIQIQVFLANTLTQIYLFHIFIAVGIHSLTHTSIPKQTLILWSIVRLGIMQKQKQNYTHTLSHEPTKTYSF